MRKCVAVFLVKTLIGSTTDAEMRRCVPGEGTYWFDHRCVSA